MDLKVLMVSSKSLERRKTNTKQSYQYLETLCIFIVHRVYCVEDYVFLLIIKKKDDHSPYNQRESL